MDQVLNRCLQVMERQPNYTVVFETDPKGPLGMFLAGFDQAFLEFYKTLRKHSGEEKYGVGMLIWQFLHREDYKTKYNRDRVQFAQFTYNATFFNRYIQPRSKDGLDRADQMLTKYLLKHVAEMQVDHPFHDRYGMEYEVLVDSPRDAFMKSIFQDLRIEDLDKGRDKWFIALKGWEEIFGHCYKDSPQAPSSYTGGHTSNISRTGGTTATDESLAATPATTAGPEDIMDDRSCIRSVRSW